MRDNLQQRQDKQLQGIALESVLEKRCLDQALNAKEFAVCAGVSYSTARSWFHLSGFPAFRGVIVWQDFVQWRTNQNGLGRQPESLPYRIVGHESKAISQVYTHMEIDTKRQAIERLPNIL